MRVQSRLRRDADVRVITGQLVVQVEHQIGAVGTLSGDRERGAELFHRGRHAARVVQREGRIDQRPDVGQVERTVAAMASWPSRSMSARKTSVSASAARASRTLSPEHSMLTRCPRAERAGCTSGLVFHTFPNKEALLAHARQLLFERAASRVDAVERQGGAPAEVLANVVFTLPPGRTGRPPERGRPRSGCGRSSKGSTRSARSTRRRTRSRRNGRPCGGHSPCWTTVTPDDPVHQAWTIATPPSTSRRRVSSSAGASVMMPATAVGGRTAKRDAAPIFSALAST